MHVLIGLGGSWCRMNSLIYASHLFWGALTQGGLYQMTLIHKYFSFAKHVIKITLFVIFSSGVSERKVFSVYERSDFNKTVLNISFQYCVINKIAVDINEKHRINTNHPLDKIPLLFDYFFF